MALLWDRKEFGAHWLSGIGCLGRTTPVAASGRAGLPSLKIIFTEATTFPSAGSLRSTTQTLHHRLCTGSRVLDLLYTHQTVSPVLPDTYCAFWPILSSERLQLKKKENSGKRRAQLPARFSCSQPIATMGLSSKSPSWPSPAPVSGLEECVRC